MINRDSIDSLASTSFSSHFKHPNYEGYAFSMIPNTVFNLLTGGKQRALPDAVVGGTYQQHEVVVLFLIDGFGWRFLEKYKDTFSSLKRFDQEGIVSKISSQFPSTTAAHITTICSGLEVGQTGIYEWFQYEPLFDRIIAPLPFCFAGEHTLNTLSKKGVPTQQIFPFTSLYQELKQSGVKSYVVQHEGIVHSSYSQAMHQGAEKVPYRSWEEALKRVVAISEQPHAEPVYVFVYFGDIDAVGHRHGIHSSDFDAIVSSCWNTMEEHYWKPMKQVHRRVATLITADHGMVSVDPKTTVYLNKIYPEILDDVVRNKEGLPLIPAGSCRDFFLHIKKEQLVKVQKKLAELLKGIAEVQFVQDLIDQGFFGALPVSRRLMERIGNLVILPYLNESVWWFEKHRFEQHFFAAHGGLTPDEMETILLFHSIHK